MQNPRSKICKWCGEEKPLSDYHKNRQTKDGKHTLCKPCNSKKASKWREENPDRAKALDYQKKYNLSLDDFNEMKTSCGGLCEICKCPEDSAPRGTLFVDHCHRTGEVRGLLCLHCNNLLGASRDDTTVLRGAIKYLERGPS